MRAKERIDNFLDKVDLKKLLNQTWNIIIEQDELEDTLWIINSHKNDINKFWKENPDLRFSQVLINMGIIPNIPGYWYYMEESEILEKQGYPRKKLTTGEFILINI